MYRIRLHDRYGYRGVGGSDSHLVSLIGIYEKTGHSGIMSFVGLRTVVTNQRGEQVALIDQRMMFR